MSVCKWVSADVRAASRISVTASSGSVSNAGRGAFFLLMGLWGFFALAIFLFMVLLLNRRYGDSMLYPIFRRTRPLVRVRPSMLGIRLACLACFRDLTRGPVQTSAHGLVTDLCLHLPDVNSFHVRDRLAGFRAHCRYHVGEVGTAFASLENVVGFRCICLCPDFGAFAGSESACFEFVCPA